MLLRLFTNSSEFKPIEFKPGFNAIVAERAADSTAQDSRNARGKSTVLMLINYVLAGNRHKSLVPLAEAGWEISLSLEMFGGTVTATRSLDKGARLTLVTDQVAGSIVEPYLVEGSIALEDWKELLGLALFRLEPEASAGRGSLSVRTLLSYVIRSETPKDPFKFMTSQPAVSSRQHVAFLLGLDWQIVRQLAEINRGLDQIGSISAAARDGLVSTLRLEEDLLLERAALKNEADEWAKQIAGFRILEDPNRLVERADTLTAEIALLRDDNVVDIRLRNLYRESLDEPDEQIVDAQGTVAALFEAAGAVLVEGFVRRLDQVEAFHASLIENRRGFLVQEIEELNSRIIDRTISLETLDVQRDNALRTLEAGGALEELSALRVELAEVQARASAVELQIEQAREIVGLKDELKLDQATKRQEASQELAVSRTKVDDVADRFSAKMRSLYAKDAALSVTVDEDGYKFSTKVVGAGSTGVDRMTLFCFDLTMLEEGVRTSHHPDFLIHDSSVFDGVDPRQRSGALRFAQQMVEATGGQYICTINSNDIPDEVRGENWFEAGVIRTVLDTEVGGLVGRTF